MSLCLVTAVFARSTAHATRVVDAVQASETFVYVFPMAPFETVTFETSGSIGDPVLHLFRPSGGVLIQVAANDNTQGVEAFISFQNGSTTMPYVLVLRGKSTSGALGATLLKRNGANITSGLTLFGGRTLPSGLFTWNAGDHARTAQRPGGSTGQIMLTFTGSSGLVVNGFGFMNSVSRSASLPMASTVTSVYIATPRVHQPGLDPMVLRSGLVNLLLNDVSAGDADNDGLGNGLETTLGTCNGLTACGFGYLPHDSDRDGLSDLEEVFGLVDGQNWSADVALPRWGAQPRRKDVFVELDHHANRVWGGSCPANTNPFQCIRDNPGTHGFFNGNGYNSDGRLNTLEGWVDDIRAPYLAGSSASLKNPDNTAGVALHFDLGVQPLSLLDEAKFGEYGSLSARRVVFDWYFQVANIAGGAPSYPVSLTVGGDGIPNLPPIPILPSPQPETPQQYLVRIAAALQQAGLVLRELVVVPAPATDAVAARMRMRVGASVNSLTITATPVDPANQDDFDIRFQHGAEDTFAQAKDYSHAERGRIHYATEQVDSVRRRKFRYGVIGGVGSGGNARDQGMAVGLLPETFVHEMGHLVGLRHWGRNEWHGTAGNSDVECLPQYRSIMSYAYGNANRRDWARYPVRFSSMEPLVFNPSRAFESGNVFGPNTNALPFGNPHHTNPNRYWDMTRHPWNYRHPNQTPDPWWSGPSGPTATSQLDQNRSGIVAAGTAHWPSLGLLAADSECRAFSAGRFSISNVNGVTGAVDLVRAGNWLFAFFARDGDTTARNGLWYVRASLGSLTNKSCTGSADPWAGTTQCLNWSTPVRLVSAPRRHVSAYLFAGRVFVAATEPPSGTIHVRRYDVQASTGVLDNGVTMPLDSPGGANQAAYQTDDPVEFTVFQALRRSPELALLFRSKQSTPFISRPVSARRLASSGTWFLAPEIQRTVDGSAILTNEAPGALAWPSPSNPNLLSANQRRTIGVFPTEIPNNPNGRCAMYILCNEASCCVDHGDGCCGNALCVPPPQRWVTNPFYGPGSAQEGMHCGSQPGLAFRHTRNANGGTQTNHSGHVMLATPGEPNGAPDTPQANFRPVRIGFSQLTFDQRVPGAVDAVHPWTASPMFDWALNSFHFIRSQSNLALYSDPDVANVFGLSVEGGNRELTFWPHMDGAPDHTFAVGDDFRVMEGEVCRLLRFPTESYQLVKSPEGQAEQPTADAYCGSFMVTSLVP